MRTTRVGFPAILAIALAVIGVVLFPRPADGQPQSFPFGTVQKVTDYAVSHVNVIGIGMWAYDTNNQPIGYYSGSWQTGKEGYFTNESSMDQFVAEQVGFVFSNFLTNTSPMLNPDKGKGMILQGFYGINANGVGMSTWPPFYTTSAILIKPDVVKGTYVVPDLSGFTVPLNHDHMPFFIKGLKWARLEVSNRGNSTPFEILDSRNDSPNDPATSLIDSFGFLELPTEVITNSSSLNGAYTLKLSVFADTFRSFDGDGNALPETPLRLSMEKTGVITTVYA
ncbi:MAG: hypothetical protein KGJ90_07225, partial [Patescibacteria group bacterium]|nr:hypothetical protein [Patescibacteria group bacterium]